MKIGSEIIPIGSVFTSRLNALGYKTWADVLEKTGNSKEIKALEKEVKIGRQQLTAWTDRARLAGVIGKRAGVLDLLTAAGVNTPKKLKMRNAENLLVKLKKVNAEKEIVSRVPTTKQLKTWIEKAKAG